MRLQAKMTVGKASSPEAFRVLPDVPANVSNQQLVSSDGYNGFQLSLDNRWPVSRLDGSQKFFNSEQGYPGYLLRVQWRAVYGEFATVSDTGTEFLQTFPKFEWVDYSLTRVLFIVFDQAANQYATKMRIKTSSETVVVRNDRVIYVHVFDQAVDSVEVEFLEWSTDNGTVRLTYVGSQLTFKGSEIESVECSEQAWSSSFKVSTGFMQQYADIVFRDHKKLLQTLSDNNMLSKFMPIDLQIENEGVWEDLGAYISDTWSVDKTENKVTVSCNDYTRNFENYIIDLIAENATVAQLFRMISSQIPEVDIVPKADSLVKDPLTGEEVSMSDYLNKCVARDVYFQGVEASRVIEELCDRWMLRLYWHPKLRKYVIMEAW